MFRKTISLDIKEKTDNEINDLLAIANENNLKVYKVALIRTGLSMLHEKVMKSENKGQTLNEMVLEYDN